MTQAAVARTSADFTLSFVLQALVQAKLLTHSQAQDVRSKEAAARARVLKQLGADKDDGRYTVSPVEVVAAFQVPLAGGRVLDQDRVSEAVAVAAGVGYRKIDPLKLDMALATRTVSKPYAQKHVLLPLERSEAGALVVAVANPFDRELMENLHRLAGQPIEPVLSAKSDILKAIADIYGFKRTPAQAATDFAPRPGCRSGTSSSWSLSGTGSKELDASDKPIVRRSTT
jgi:general secretion pathway protein E